VSNVDYSLPQFIDKNDDGVEYTYDANGNMTSDYNKETIIVLMNYLMRRIQNHSQPKD
jgi:hypothetical protein